MDRSIKSSAMKELVLILLLLQLFSTCMISATDTLTPAQPLSDGELLVSAGGSFALGFFSPTNQSGNRYVGIWFYNITVHTVVWVANRQNPIPGSAGLLTLTGDGALTVAASRNSTALWSSPTAGLRSPVAQLLDDGNFVVREANGGAVAWQSFDHPTDTLLPGMKLGPDFAAGLSRNLTGWRSGSDPAPGEYTIAMDVRGDPQMCVWLGAERKWRAGPWNGVSFSGMPEMVNYTKVGFSFQFEDTAREIYYEYNVSRGPPVIITRLVMNWTGKAERYVWLGDAWNLFWYTPKTQCGGFSPCGPFGMCNPNESPICSCAPGFDPRSPRDWEMRDGSGGCVRRSAVGGEEDGFFTLSNAQLPDTAFAAVDRRAGLAECRTRCLGNRSCTAYSSADVRGGGSGCIMWVTELVGLGQFVEGGQDLYIRLNAGDLASITNNSNKKGHGHTVAIIVGVVAAAVVVLILTIGCCLWRRNRKMAYKIRGDRDIEGDNDLELPLFDKHIVVAATDNFAIHNKLGEGGFGPVYKGKLPNGQEIAVKRLSETSLQGIDELKNEVTLISKLQHRNLVQLLGCCIQADERILIYEYLSNKSLDVFLFDKANNTSGLDWHTRYKIILGIGSGLLYLHQDSRFPIIHRDLKASNILLDKHMNPKISDFGLARIFAGNDIATRTIKVVGTYGYMAPEYAMDGIFSVKSDVYSFGVLLLEIISGQKNKGVYLSTRDDVYLLGNAWKLMKEGKVSQLVDPSMGHTFSVSQVTRCIHVGLLCVQQFPEDRPTMSTVLFMLGNESASLPEPKRPGFVMRRGYCSTSSTSKEESCSMNDVTISNLVGR